MLLRLRANASRADLDAVLGLARDLGYETRFLDGGRQVVEGHAQGAWGALRPLAV